MSDLKTGDYPEQVQRIFSECINCFKLDETGRLTESTGNINFSLDVSLDLKDKNVIIVEDIVDTGRTLSFLKKYMVSKSPKSLKVCTMLDKKEIYLCGTSINYIGNKISTIIKIESESIKDYLLYEVDKLIL